MVITTKRQFCPAQGESGNEGTEIRRFVMTTRGILVRPTYSMQLVKLREIALNYRVPRQAVEKLGIRDLNISLYSRNIMIWTKNAGMGIDPERAYQSSGNGTFKQGVERFNAEPWVVPVGFKVGFTF